MLEGFSMQPPLDHDLVLSHFKSTLDASKLHRVTIPEVARRVAKEKADTELYIFRQPNGPRITITGQQFFDITQTVASSLIKIGVKYLDRIGLISPNCQEYVYADYGILMAGGGVVRLHSSFMSGEDVVHILNKAECKGLIVVPGPDNEYLHLLKAMIPNIETMPVDGFRCGNIPSLEFVMVTSNEVHGGMKCLCLKAPGSANEKTEQATLVEDRLTEIKPEDPCSFYMTSGSTGFPKLVALNHLHLVNSVCLRARTPAAPSIKDRPFSHLGGSTLITSLRGVPAVYIDPKTTVSTGNTDFFFQVIEEERVKSVMFFPYILHDLLEVLETKRFDLSSVTSAKFGGQCIARNIFEKCIDYIPNFLNCYAMTEAGTLLAATIPSDPKKTKLDFTGYPCPFHEFKVVDEDGGIVPVSTPGMLYVKTPLLFVCYWNDQEKTKSAKGDDGWFRTDDIAVMNERGYLNILGRKTEVIMKASINIYPMTVERFLLGHPKVDQVIVVGVPDERVFEEVCACIISKTGSGLTAAEMEAYCDENLLLEGSADGLGLKPGYFLIWESFPHGMSQKIDKKAIKMMAAKQLGLSKN